MLHAFKGPHRCFALEPIGPDLVIYFYPHLEGGGYKSCVFGGEAKNMPDPGKAQAWADGEGYAQDMLAPLSADAREFLISGTTPEEWEDLSGVLAFFLFTKT